MGCRLFLIFTSEEISWREENLFFLIVKDRLSETVFFFANVCQTLPDSSVKLLPGGAARKRDNSGSAPHALHLCDRFKVGQKYISVVNDTCRLFFIEHKTK